MQIYNHIKMYCVYAIKCNLTNKTYIGSTSNLTNRLGNHISGLKVENQVVTVNTF